MGGKWSLKTPKYSAINGQPHSRRLAILSHNEIQIPSICRTSPAKDSPLGVSFQSNSLLDYIYRRHIVPDERIWHHWTPLLLECVLSQYECSGLGAAGVLSCANCTKWNFYLLGKAETSFAPVAAKWEGGKLKVWKYNCLSSVLWCLFCAFYFCSTMLLS